jgi:hypothetical protein
VSPDEAATREAGQQLADAARTLCNGDTVRALHWLLFRWRSAPDPYERAVQAAASITLLAMLKAER